MGHGQHHCTVINDSIVWLTFKKSPQQNTVYILLGLYGSSFCLFIILTTQNSISEEADAQREAVGLSQSVSQGGKCQLHNQLWRKVQRRQVHITTQRDGSGASWHQASSLLHERRLCPWSRWSESRHHSMPRGRSEVSRRGSLGIQAAAKVPMIMWPEILSLVPCLKQTDS